MKLHEITAAFQKVLNQRSISCDITPCGECYRVYGYEVWVSISSDETTIRIQIGEQLAECVNDTQEFINTLDTFLKNLSIL
jgi:hypothetical protein